MATLNTRYVDPDAAAGGNGTTNALSGANCAYKSLAIWEAARQADLVTGDIIEECVCESSHANHTADTTLVQVDGWTTDATRYIDIKTSASGRHAGVWDTAKYRLSVAGTRALSSNEAYVRITGAQIETRSPVAVGHVTLAFDVGTTTSDVRVINSIIRGHGDATYWEWVVWTTGTAITLMMRNNLIIRCSASSSAEMIRFATGATGSGTFYNNTLVAGGNIGVGLRAMSAVVTSTNNLVDAGTGVDFIQTTGTLTNITCSSTDGTADDFGGSGNRVNQTFTFVNAPTDYHLASTDGGAKDFGTDLSGTFTDDIDGVTRTGTWDIGADEYVASGRTSKNTHPWTLGMALGMERGVGGVCS